MNHTHCHHRGLRLVLAALFAGLVLGLVAPKAKAGELDVQLLGWARENVLYQLHELKAKGKKKEYNVGVLPFLVDKGKSKGYEIAPLSLNIVPRLENALIMGQHPKGDVVGIVRDATSTAEPAALKACQGETCSKEDFDKLFETKYVRAWGEKGKPKKVTVDAFLTGVITSPYPKKPEMVRVVFQIIDRTCYDAKEKRVKPKDLGFEMAVLRDRDLMSDLGIAYTIPASKVKRFLSRDTRPSDRDRKAVPIDEDEKAVAEVGGMTFQVYYKTSKDKSGPGKEQDLKKNGDFFEVAPPPVGAKVTMVLTPKKKLEQTIGVVVKVNGQSVWQKQDEPNELCQKWLFEKGRTKKEEFKGFYFDLDGNYEEFEVTDKGGVGLGKQVGWIELDFFAEGEKPRYKDKPDPKQTPKEKTLRQKDEESDQKKLLSSRSVGSTLKWDGKARHINVQKLTSSDLGDLQKALREANKVELEPIKYSDGKGQLSGSQTDASRSVITSGGRRTSGPSIQTGGPIPHPESIGRILIRYDPKAKR